MTEWLDYFQVEDSRRKGLAKSVIAIFDFRGLDLEPPKAMGSGFLFRNRKTVETAKHVVNSINEDLLVCVIDYFQVREDDIIEIGPLQKYSVESVSLSGKADSASVKLDLTVMNRTPLEIAGATLSRNDKVFVIGYPVAGPVKFSPDCVVTDINEKTFEIALQGTQSLSGAPVINSSPPFAVEGLISAGITGNKTLCVKASFFL